MELLTFRLSNDPPPPAAVERFNCRLTLPHRDILAILLEVEQYRSPTEAMESFLAHWAVAPQRHRLTAQYAPDKGFTREERGRQLLALLRSGRSAGGAWIIARIYDAIALLVPAGIAPAAPPPADHPFAVELPPLNPRVTLNLTAAYARILDTMCRRERYRSATEAMESFLGHWALCPLPHRLTGPLASMRGNERERYGQEVLALLESGRSIRGSWLKARTYEAIKALLGREAQDPRVDEVLAILPDVVDVMLQKEFG